jgi:hypothetical protein
VETYKVLSSVLPKRWHHLSTGGKFFPQSITVQNQGYQNYEDMTDFWRALGHMEEKNQRYFAGTRTYIMNVEIQMQKQNLNISKVWQGRKRLGKIRRLPTTTTLLWMWIIVVRMRTLGTDGMCWLENLGWREKATGGIRKEWKPKTSQDKITFLSNRRLLSKD